MKKEQITVVCLMGGKYMFIVKGGNEPPDLLSEKQLKERLLKYMNIESLAEGTAFTFKIEVELIVGNTDD